MFRIAGPTLGSTYCYVPFLYLNEPSYFCVENQGLFQCETDDSIDVFDTCNLGKYEFK